MFNIDRLFIKSFTQCDEWIFNENVAKVFQNMAQRSIPGYCDIVRTIGLLSRKIVRSSSNIYDLGCSLGAVSVSIQDNIDISNCHIIAIDNSSAMIERCRYYVSFFRGLTPIRTILADIRNVNIEKASLVVLNFTLQFIDRKDHIALLKNIYNGLYLGGALILSEKFHISNKINNNLFHTTHLELKHKNNYSNKEIEQKNKVITNSMYIENINNREFQLKKIGFSNVDIWFKYLNFGSFIAFK